MDEQILLQILKQLEEITILITKQERQEKQPWGKPGRPTKEREVFRYRDTFAHGTKMQCVRATDMSIKTVSKYWDLYEKKE
jgi:hypothetical protein